MLITQSEPGWIRKHSKSYGTNIIISIWYVFGSALLLSSLSTFLSKSMLKKVLRVNQFKLEIYFISSNFFDVLMNIRWYRTLMFFRLTHLISQEPILPNFFFISAYFFCFNSFAISYSKYIFLCYKLSSVTVKVKKKKQCLIGLRLTPLFQVCGLYHLHLLLHFQLESITHIRWERGSNWHRQK